MTILEKLIETSVQNITEGIKPITEIFPKADIAKEHVDIVPDPISTNKADLYIAGNHGEPLDIIKMNAISLALSLSSDNFFTKYSYERKNIVFDTPEQSNKLNVLEEISKLHVDRLREHSEIFANKINNRYR